MQENIHFFYTNDLHSDFTNWSRVTHYLNNERKKKQINNKSTFIVDTGDHVDRVNPIAEAFMGKANIDLMNDVNYDVVTLGNNEGITLAHEDLVELYDGASFDVVCANLESKTNKQPDWLQSTTVLESKKGVKIGVIGLTAPFNAFYHLLDWHVVPPSEALNNHIEALDKATDIIILLSHLGINEDRHIASNFPEIDVIIGGHTHHLLRTEERMRKTIITAAGKHCAYVGEVILTWDFTEEKLIKKEAYTTNITHLPKDKNTEVKLKKLNNKANDLLNKTVSYIDENLQVDPFNNTVVIQKLTNTLMEWTNADCAMLNAGILLEGFKAGPITYKDIHQACPHPINPCTVELTGDEIYEVVRGATANDFVKLQLKGFGFRGKTIGKMIFSGLDIKLGTYDNGQQYVKEIMYNRQPLQRKQTLTIATADMFTFGRLLPEIAKSTTKKYFLPEFIRDILAYMLKMEFN